MQLRCRKKAYRLGMRVAVSRFAYREHKHTFHDGNLGEMTPFKPLTICKRAAAVDRAVQGTAETSVHTPLELPMSPFSPLYAVYMWGDGNDAQWEPRFPRCWAWAGFQPLSKSHNKKTQQTRRFYDFTVLRMGRVQLL